MRKSYRMLKGLFVFILGVMCWQGVQAQKQDTLLYFMKNTGEVVAGLKSADYFIMVLPPGDDDRNLYRVNEFYADGKKKLVTKSTNSELPLRFQGPCVGYFENGHKSLFQTLEDGMTTGDIISYYPNGNIYAIYNLTHNENHKFYFKECRDSTGKVLCENGNGTWMQYNTDYKYSDGGNIKNGLEDGEWGGQVSDSISYKCVYKKGRVIAGEGYYKNGKPHPYKQIRVLPKFQDGLITNFSDFIKTYKRYPEYANKHNIHGSVFVGFTIDRDGNINDIKILRGQAPSLNEEALRLVELSPAWSPGILYGIAVSMNISIEVYF